MPQNTPTVCFSHAFQIPASIDNSIDAHLKHEPVIVILSTNEGVQAG